MEKIKFGEWFAQVLAQRGITQADFVRLSKQAGATMDSAVVSNLINGKRNAGPDTCKNISHILKIPLNEVYIAAGMMPEEPERNPTIAATAELMKDMPNEEQEDILEYARLRHTITKKKEHPKPAKSRRAQRGNVST